MATEAQIFCHMQIFNNNLCVKTTVSWTSLVMWWIRICLSVQGTWVLSLGREDPACCGTQLLTHTLEPVSHNSWSLSAAAVEAHVCKPACFAARGHHDEKKPAHCSESSPCLPWLEKNPCSTTKIPLQPKINNRNKLLKITLWLYQLETHLKKNNYCPFSAFWNLHTALLYFMDCVLCINSNR